VHWLVIIKIIKYARYMY